MATGIIALGFKRYGFAAEAVVAQKILKTLQVELKDLAGVIGEVMLK